MVGILDGATFTGKTNFIRELLRRFDSNTNCYMLDDDWVEFLVSKASEKGTEEDCVKSAAEELSKYNFICIDNMDFLSGRNTIQELSAHIFSALDGSTGIILAGIDMKNRLGRMFEVLEEIGTEFYYIDYQH